MRSYIPNNHSSIIDNHLKGLCYINSTNSYVRIYKLFMQNKPNFRMAKMNVSNIITRNYKNFIPLAGQKNKPNSNPISSKAKIACQKIWPHPVATGRIERGCALPRVMVLRTLNAQLRTLVPHWREPGQSDSDSSFVCGNLLKVQ